MKTTTMLAQALIDVPSDVEVARATDTTTVVLAATFEVVRAGEKDDVSAATFAQPFSYCSRSKRETAIN